MCVCCTVWKYTRVYFNVNFNIVFKVNFNIVFKTITCAFIGE